MSLAIDELSSSRIDLISQEIIKESITQGAIAFEFLLMEFFKQIDSIDKSRFLNFKDDYSSDPYMDSVFKPDNL